MREMIFEHASKHKLLLRSALFVFLALGLFVFFYAAVIFQEGNPWPQIKGIAQLTIGGVDMVVLSGAHNEYVTKSKGGDVVIDMFMKDRGYKYVEQMGSGYFYKSSDKTTVLTRRQYSRFYTIWTIEEVGDHTDSRVWVTTTNDQGVTFQYPKVLLAHYVNAVKWPPSISRGVGAYVCEITPQEVSSTSNITVQRVVDDQTYCVHIRNESAADSVYTAYDYVTLKNDARIKVGFILQYPHCNNYDEEQRISCANEREVFDVDAIVDRVVRTIR